jgi:hypothetical protein
MIRPLLLEQGLIKSESTEMHRDKIEASLSAALQHLDDAYRTLLSNSDDQALSDLLWSAFAETEYAVFLLSLIQGEKSQSASWKYSPVSKQSIEFEPALTSARKLIKSATVKISTGDFEKSYEETWIARNSLLKAQELLEKKLKRARK